QVVDAEADERVVGSEALVTPARRDREAQALVGPRRGGEIRHEDDRVIEAALEALGHLRASRRNAMTFGHESSRARAWPSGVPPYAKRPFVTGWIDASTVVGTYGKLTRCPPPRYTTS